MADSGRRVSNKNAVVLFISRCEYGGQIQVEEKRAGEAGESPGGVRAQALHLKEEGHDIIAGKVKKPSKVKDFEKVLV